MRETDYLFIDFRDQLFQRTGFMRGFTIKHLVKDDSHGPDVTFGGIGATVEDLGAHVHRTTDQRLMDLV